MTGTAKHRTLDELEDLAAQGVIDDELVARHPDAVRGALRVRREDEALSLCWCGYDMVEHGIDVAEPGDGDSAPIQDHAWLGSGTKDLSWLLGVNRHRGLFEHDHDRATFADGRSVSEVCVLCRVESA